MAVGFRKSLFGFNCGDVMRYIEDTHKTFSEKETALNEQMQKIKEELSLSKEDCNKLDIEKKRLSEQLKTFNEKYEEIERLSDNIGKLYLVAQANAQAIMTNANENANLSDQAVAKNLDTIDEAHTSLNQLRESIVKISDDFVSEINGLIDSLNETREKVSANTTLSKEYKNQFEELYESLVK